MQFCVITLFTAKESHFLLSVIIERNTLFSQLKLCLEIYACFIIFYILVKTKH